jgi:hydrogenase nickel incorporation protein HypA/HybF
MPVHELALAQAIVDTASEIAGDGRVVRIVLEIGALALVVPDALRFGFDLVAADTPVAGAELAIVETPGRARCRDCDGEVALARPFGRCGCGSSDLAWISGEELRIKTVEVQ